MIAWTDLLWTVGFLEGEGSFLLSSNTGLTPTVSAAQVQRWPLDRLATLFGGKIQLVPPHRKNQSPCHRWYITGATAIGVMQTLYTFLSPKRRAQIQTAIAKWRSRRPMPSLRSACPKGHPYSPKKGGRYCPTCERDRGARNRRARGIPPRRFRHRTQGALL